jgi:tetratricopeptide (TPR) repeat protein
MSGHDVGKKKEVPLPDALPAPLHMTGLGNSHLDIGATPEAQMWFDQGLNALHDFWDYEAERAFEQGIRVDPNCAMCYWGLQRSMGFRNGGDSYSKAALDSAVRLRKHASKEGRLLIDAAAAEQAESNAPHGAAPSDAEPKSTQLYREIVKKFPNDPQAKIFLANTLLDGYTDAGEPKPGTVKAIALYEAILKTSPNDSATNHYWIHAMEPSNHPERAIPSAKLLASLAPASGHMVHMPGHIFYRVGDYAHAEIWFAQSTAVDEAYMRDQHVAVDDDWNYTHNLMYGIANLMEEGKLQQATALSAKLTAAHGELAATLYPWAPRDSMTRVSTQLPVALRSGDWQRVNTLLASSEADTKLENLLFLAGQLKQFATGMTAVEAGDLASAQAASNALDAELWHKSQAMQAMKDMPKPTDAAKVAPPAVPTVDIMPDAMPEPLMASLSIMSLELRGSILAAQKKLPEAKALFADAAKKEKALGYREPPTYIRPVGETEGLALLGAGDAAGAHDAYAAALVERPNSGFALYGLARSSEAAGHTDTARAEYTKFLEAWRDSDPSTPELAHARQFLTGQSVVAQMRHLIAQYKGPSARMALSQPTRRELLLRVRKPLVDLIPVDDVPPGRQVLRPPVVVLQVVRMLPDVVAQDRI